MKIIDRYILLSYLQRLTSVFVILMLIFIIQTFWLFIDEFAGKGIDFEVVLKFLLYYSPKLIPLVLPLSVLLAAIMTYGTLAENFEFAAMKSTGISLQRALRGWVIFHFFLGSGSYYFANYVMPYGEFKYYNLRRNLGQLKPALAITEGIFNEIGEMNIKVKEKYGEDNRFLRDVIIHERTPDRKNHIVIKAAEGELKSAKIGQQLQLILYNGNRYEEVQTTRAKEKRKMPHAKASFEKYIMNIDLSQFNNVDLNQEKYKSTFRMQKTEELTKSIDSLEVKFSNERTQYAKNLMTTSLSNPLITKDIKDTVALNDSLYHKYTSVLSFLTDEKYFRHAQVIRTAQNNTKSIINNLEGKKKNFFIYQKLINLHKNAYHEKYNLGFSIFFLFLIGAALGAIIRKGGLGLPMVLAVVIFLTFHYVGLFGKNAAEDNSISPFFGSWLSQFIFAPIAFYFAYKASTDQGVFNVDNIIEPLKKQWNKINIPTFVTRKRKN